MKRVFLCGNSVLLAGLASALEKASEVQVTQRSALSGTIELMDFDVVVVDFDHVDAADVLAILRARPDLQVVGVNAAAGAVTVLSGKVYLAHSLDDVIQCLDEDNLTVDAERPGLRNE